MEAKKTTSDDLHEHILKLVEQLHLRLELCEHENARLRGILRDMRHPAGREPVGGE